MWSLKFLSGPKVGKQILLPQGLLLIGRDKKCAISIFSSSVSKEHAQLLVKEDFIEIEDKGSSNGTFIEGKQIRKAQLKEGDRVCLSSEVIFEIFKAPAPLMNPLSHEAPYAPPVQSSEAPVSRKNSLIKNLSESIKNYVHATLLPGAYQLAARLEFKPLIARFVGAFVILVISLSSVPLISILKSSVEQESLNNAETIAQSLARSNVENIKKGFSSALNVDYALRRPGVKKALLISAVDGRILAPSHLAHTFPKESYIHSARLREEKTVKKVDSSSLLAVVPISLYSPETGNTIPKAYSVVIYSMDSLNEGIKKVFGLLAQISLIALLLGAVLFFFLIHIIEFPLRSINHQIGKALKEEQSPSIHVNYQSQVLNDLCSHINSALNQISLGKMIQSQREELSAPRDRKQEMSHLVEVIGFPALAISMEDKHISALNAGFAEQMGLSEILHQSLEELADEGLKEHLLSLIEQGELNPQEISFSELIFNGTSFQSTCIFIMGPESPDYALISFIPVESNEEVA